MSALFLIFFGSDMYKMDKTWSNWISHQSKKMLLLKVVTFTERIEIIILFLIFLDQICQKWIKLVGQKQIFGSNGFSAETGFHPRILLSNLKCLFGHFFKWICLTSQSIERFGSPLMAESFQACFVALCKSLCLNLMWSHDTRQNQQIGNDYLGVDI